MKPLLGWYQMISLLKTYVAQRLQLSNKLHSCHRLLQRSVTNRCLQQHNDWHATCCCATKLYNKGLQQISRLSSALAFFLIFCSFISNHGSSWFILTSFCGCYKSRPSNSDENSNKLENLVLRQKRSHSLGLVISVLRLSYLWLM